MDELYEEFQRLKQIVDEEFSHRPSTHQQVVDQLNVVDKLMEEAYQGDNFGWPKESLEE